LNGWLLLAPLLLGLPLLGIFSMLVGGVGLGRFGSLRVGAREGLLWAAVLWAALATLVASALSIGAGHDPLAETGGHLSRGPLAIFWGVAALLGAFAIWRRRVVLVELGVTTRDRLGTFTRFERFLLGFSIVSVAIISLIGLISAPTTWDSMTYHLARVAVWLQLGGSSHYATSAEPQLFQPPGSELLIAQLQALTGGDRLAAGVQSVAFALAIVAATSIARSLGGDRRAQLLAAFLTATTPMAIMQGSSTQNDLLVGLWLMIVGALALKLLDDIPSPTRYLRAAVATIAVALAIVTKGTAWVYLPPLLILLAVAIVRSVRWRGFATSAVVGLLALALLAGPSMLANHQTFGKYVFTGSGAFDYGADVHTPGSLTSNLVRNAAIHLGTPIEEVNDHTTQLIDDALDIVGIDADAAATTFPGQTFTVPLAGPEEGHAPDPLLFALGLLALAMTFFSPAFRTRRRVSWAVVVLGGIAIFALLFKWQPFHSRLHLPAELLMVPLVAVALDRAWHGRRANAILVGTICAFAAIIASIFLLLNVDRPLIGRSGHPSILTTPRAQQYFAQRPEFAEPYTKIVERVRSRGDRQLALVGGFDDWYYPFSALLGKDARLSYSLVANASARYPQVDRNDITALVCINCDTPTKVRLAAMGLAVAPGMSFDVTRSRSRGGAVIELWERPRDQND
jgi:hypothetical protein